MIVISHVLIDGRMNKLIDDSFGKVVLSKDIENVRLLVRRVKIFNKANYSFIDDC